MGLLGEATLKIRVAAPDTESADQLAQRLAGVADAAAVQSEGTWAEVLVRPGVRGDRLIGRVLHTVEEWLDETDVDSATVHLDDHAYVLARDGVSATQAAG